MEANTRLIVNRWLPLVFGFWVIGIALKFLTFQVILNENLYAGNVLEGAVFPYFPNVLDSALIISVTLYLVWRTRRIEP